MDLDKINEQLAELKLTKDSPDIKHILSKFEWSREWFLRAEDALLSLAFRGESDRPILEFIRTKILETDVITFNKFLRTQSASTITNHYEMLIENKYFAELIKHCKNGPVLDALLRDYIDFSEIVQLSDKVLSGCDRDMIVEYLIENPSRIDWTKFTKNTNPKAVEFCIKNKHISTGKCNSFLSQCTDSAVMCQLHNWRSIDYTKFSMIPNDMAVDHLLANPSLIDFVSLARNTNDRAVDYLLNNPKNINWFVFCYNSNPKAVRYVLDNANGNSLYYASSNPNDIMVDYLISHTDQINWNAFYTNISDKAAEFLINRCTWYTIRYMSVNQCNYNTQKLREFNKLALFPRIQYLVI